MTRQNDVVHGYGQIPWAKAVHAKSGGARFAAGWVLPGGERTTDRERALTVAKAIDLEFERKGRRPVRFNNPHSMHKTA